MKYFIVLLIIVAGCATLPNKPPDYIKLSGTPLIDTETGRVFILEKDEHSLYGYTVIEMLPSGRLIHYKE